MKITRVLTYIISEDYVRDYFDECWWEDKTEPDETDYDFFLDGLREECYDNEEILPDQGTKEKIKQIWQEECDRYHRGQDPEIKKEQLRNELQNCKDIIEIYKNRITQLEEWLKNA